MKNQLEKFELLKKQIVSFILIKYLYNPRRLFNRFISMKVCLAYVLLLAAASIDVHLCATNSENIFTRTYNKIRKKINSFKRVTFKHDYSIKLNHYDWDWMNLFGDKRKSVSKPVKRVQDVSSPEKVSPKKLTEFKVKIPPKHRKKISMLSKRVEKSREMRKSLENNLKMHYGENWYTQLDSHPEYKKNLEALGSVETTSKRKIRDIAVYHMLEQNNIQHYGRVYRDYELAKRQLNDALAVQDVDSNKIRFLRRNLKNRKSDVDAFEDFVTNRALLNGVSDESDISSDRTKSEGAISDYVDKMALLGGEVSAKNSKLAKRGNSGSQENVDDKVERRPKYEENPGDEEVTNPEKEKAVDDFHNAVAKEEEAREKYIEALSKEPKNEEEVKSAKEEFENAKQEREKQEQHVKETYGAAALGTAAVIAGSVSEGPEEGAIGNVTEDSLGANKEEDVSRPSQEENSASSEKMESFEEKSETEAKKETDSVHSQTSKDNSSNESSSKTEHEENKSQSKSETKKEVKSGSSGGILGAIGGFFGFSSTKDNEKEESSQNTEKQETVTESKNEEKTTEAKPKEEKKAGGFFSTIGSFFSGSKGEDEEKKQESKVNSAQQPSTDVSNTLSPSKVVPAPEQTSSGTSAVPDSSISKSSSSSGGLFGTLGGLFGVGASSSSSLPTPTSTSSSSSSGTGLLGKLTSFFDGGSSSSASMSHTSSSPSFFQKMKNLITMGTTDPAAKAASLNDKLASLKAQNQIKDLESQIAAEKNKSSSNSSTTSSAPTTNPSIASMQNELQQLQLQNQIKAEQGRFASNTTPQNAPAQNNVPVQQNGQMVMMQNPMMGMAGMMPGMMGMMPGMTGTQTSYNTTYQPQEYTDGMSDREKANVDLLNANSKKESAKFDLDNLERQLKSVEELRKQRDKDPSNMMISASLQMAENQLAQIQSNLCSKYDVSDPWQLTTQLKKKMADAEYEADKATNAISSEFKEREGNMVFTPAKSAVLKAFGTKQQKQKHWNEIIENNQYDIREIQNDIDRFKRIDSNLKDLEEQLSHTTDPAERSLLEHRINNAQKLKEDTMDTIKNKYTNYGLDLGNIINQGKDPIEYLESEVKRKQDNVDAATVEKAGLISKAAAEDAKKRIAKRKENEEKVKKEELGKEVEKLEKLIEDPKTSPERAVVLQDDLARAKKKMAAFELPEKKAQIEEKVKALKDPKITPEKRRQTLAELEKSINEYNEHASVNGLPEFSHKATDLKVVNDAQNAVKKENKANAEKEKKQEKSAGEVVAGGGNGTKESDKVKESTPSEEHKKVMSDKKAEIEKAKSERNETSNAIKESKQKAAEIKADKARLADLEQQIQDCDTSTPEGEDLLLDLTKKKMALNDEIQKKYNCEPGEEMNAVNNALKTETSKTKALNEKQKQNVTTLADLEAEYSDMEKAQSEATRVNQTSKKEANAPDVVVTTGVVAGGAVVASSSKPPPENDTKTEEKKEEEKPKNKGMSLEEEETEFVKEVSSKDDEESSSKISKPTLEGEESAFAKESEKKTSTWDKVKSAVSTGASAVGSVASAVGSGIQTAVINTGSALSTATNFVTNNASTILAVGAGAAAIAGGVAVAANWDNITGAVSGAVDNIKEGISNAIGNAKEGIANTVSNVKDTVASKVADAKEKVAEVKENIQEKTAEVKANIQEKVEDAKEKISEVKENIQEKVTEVKEKITDVKENVQKKVEEVQKKLEPVTKAAQSLGSAAVNLGGAVLGVGGTLLEAGANTLAAGAENLAGGITDFNAKMQEDGVAGAVSDAIGSVKDAVNNKIQDAKEKLGNVASSVGSALVNAGTSALAGAGLAGGVLASGAELLKDKVSDVKDALQNGGAGDLLSGAKDLIQNIAGGTGDLLNNVLSGSGTVGVVLGTGMNYLTDKFSDFVGTGDKVEKPVSERAFDIKNEINGNAKGVLANKELAGRLEMVTDSKGNRVNIADLLEKVASGVVLSKDEIKILEDPKIKESLERLGEEYGIHEDLGKGIHEILEDGTRSIDQIKSELHLKEFVNAGSSEEASRYKGQLKSIEADVNGNTLSMYDIVSKISDGTATKEEVQALAGHSEALGIIRDLDATNGTNIGNFVMDECTKHGIEPARDLYVHPSITEEIKGTHGDVMASEKITTEDKDVHKVVKEYSKSAGKMLENTLVGDHLKDIDKHSSNGVRVSELIERISKGEKIFETEIRAVTKDPNLMESVKSVEAAYGVSIVGMLTGYASQYELIEPSEHASKANEKITAAEDYKTFGDVSLKEVLRCIEEGKISEINPAHVEKLLDHSDSGLRGKVEELERMHGINIIAPLEKVREKILENKINSVEKTTAYGEDRVQQKLQEDNAKIQESNERLLKEHNDKVTEQSNKLNNTSTNISNILENHPYIFEKSPYSEEHKGALGELKTKIDAVNATSNPEERAKLSKELHEFMGENRGLLVAINQDFPGTVNVTSITVNSTFPEEPELQKLKTEEEVAKELKENSSPYDLGATLEKMNATEEVSGVSTSVLKDAKEVLDVIKNGGELNEAQSIKLNNLLENHKGELKIIEAHTGSAIVDHMQNHSNKEKKLATEKQEFVNHVQEVHRKQEETKTKVHEAFGAHKNRSKLHDRVKDIAFSHTGGDHLQHVFEKFANGERVTKGDMFKILSNKGLVDQIKHLEREEHVKILDRLEKYSNENKNYSISDKAKLVNDKLSHEMAETYFNGIDVKDIVSRIEAGEFEKINHEDLKVLLTPALEGGLKDQLVAVEHELNVNIVDLIENAHGIKVGEKVEEFKTEKSKYEALAKTGTAEKAEHLENSPYNTKNILEKLSDESKSPSAKSKLLKENGEITARNDAKKEEHEAQKKEQTALITSSMNVLNDLVNGDKKTGLNQDETGKIQQVLDSLSELRETGDFHEAQAQLGEFIINNSDLVEKLENLHGDKLSINDLYHNLEEIEEPKYEELHEIEQNESGHEDHVVEETKNKIKEVFEQEHSGKPLTEEQKSFIKDLHQNNKGLITEVEKRYDVKVGDYLAYMNSSAVLEEEKAGGKKAEVSKIIDTTKHTIEGMSIKANTITDHKFTHDALKSLEKKYPTKISIPKVLEKIQKGEEISKDVINAIFSDETLKKEVQALEDKTGHKILDTISSYAHEYDSKGVRDSVRSDISKIPEGTVYAYMGDTKLHDLMKDIANGKDLSKHKEYIEELKSNEMLKTGLSFIERECGVDLSSKIEFASKEIQTKEMQVLHNNVHTAIAAINNQALDRLVNEDHSDIHISTEEAVSVAEALSAIEKGEPLEQHKQAIEELHASGKLVELDRKLGLPISECMKYVATVDNATYNGNKINYNAMAETHAVASVSAEDRGGNVKSVVVDKGQEHLNKSIEQFTSYINEQMEALNAKIKEVDEKIAGLDEHGTHKTMTAEEIHEPDTEGGHTNIAEEEEFGREERIPTEEEIMGKEKHHDMHFEERHGSAHESARHGFKNNRVNTNTTAAAS